jgi:uncharacterized protein
MHRFLAFGAGLALALCLAPGTAFGWEPAGDGLAPIPPLAARVTDLTQTLGPGERQALEAKLANWEARTSNQFAVLLVPSTQPEPIEAYSIRVAEAWKIGRKGNDNGVLLVVAKNDRKVRIEVGYGLEGTLTDVTASRIIREDIAPRFRDGKFAVGIEAGVDRIIAVVAEGKPPPARQATRPAQQTSFDLGTLAMVVLVVIPVAGTILRAIFGRLLGSTIGGGIVGIAAWFVVGSLAIAFLIGVVAFFVLLVVGLGSGLSRRGGGVWVPGSGGSRGGGWGGGSSGGGGFSGGGGSFGGGGASGNW